MKFKKGQSGNPAGRPSGGRNKFSEAFIADFAATWEAHGKAALITVATDDPGTFVRVAASLMPKEAEVTLRNISAKELADDELAAIAAGSGEGDSAPASRKSQLN